MDKKTRFILVIKWVRERMPILLTNRVDREKIVLKKTTLKKS
jgi:hypothetical protein